MKLLRLAAFAAVVSLAACTSSPTDSARAGDPSFDGINTMGSGNYVAESGTNLIGSGTESTSDGGNGLDSGNYSDDGLANTGTTPADTTSRGPGMLGSGN